MARGLRYTDIVRYYIETAYIRAVIKYTSAHAHTTYYRKQNLETRLAQKASSRFAYFILGLFITNGNVSQTELRIHIKLLINATE